MSQNIATSSSSTCPSHASALTITATALHRHTYCAHDGQPRFDLWQEAVTGGTLIGAFGVPTGVQMLADAIARGECPECHTKLSRQGNEQTGGWCAKCRMSVGQGLLDAALGAHRRAAA